MIKSDINHSIKNVEDLRKQIKLDNNKRQSEMADVKMKLSQLAQKETLTAKKTSHLGTIDFTNIGNVIAGQGTSS